MRVWNFGDTPTRDRLVCGINDGGIQLRLLSEDVLTFNKALTFLRGMEAVNGDKGPENRPNGTERRGGRCRRQDAAGREDRLQMQGRQPLGNRFAEEKCPHEGKVGQIKRACRMKKKGKSKHVQGEAGKFSQRANFMQEEEEEVIRRTFLLCTT